MLNKFSDVDQARNSDYLFTQGANCDKESFSNPGLACFRQVFLKAIEAIGGAMVVSGGYSSHRRIKFAEDMVSAFTVLSSPPTYVSLLFRE